MQTGGWCSGVVVALACGAPAFAGGPAGVWTTPAELAALPTIGPSWEALVDYAAMPAGRPAVGDKADNTDVLVMAKALVYARVGGEDLRNEVIAICMSAIGTEQVGNTLSLGRNIVGYVIAADLVGLPPSEDEAFRAWLVAALDENLEGRTLRTTNLERPNNWGTHAGAACAAIAVYLHDDAELAAVAQVFRGWLGDRDAYSGFTYGDPWWQADASAPVGINPAGAQINGYSIDGVLPDDQRRGGPFIWPPLHVNYVYEALQGAVAQAVILSRRGYDVWNWQDQAILRAFKWLHQQAGFPPHGDDTWQPHVINWAYGPCFPAPVPASPGKNVGWTDWTHHVCTADLNGDGTVNGMDLLVMLAGWGTASPCPGDQDGDGSLTVFDLLQVLEAWGGCP